MVTGSNPVWGVLTKGQRVGTRNGQNHPGYSKFLEHWLLNPDITFLNHGSFGACPIPVLQAQQQWRERLERQPLQFLGEDFEALLDAAISELASFVKCPAKDLVFVANATTGINTVLRSLKFEPGNEILTTNHEYNACRNALDYMAERTGATIVVATIPFPIASPDQIIEAVMSCVSERTQLVLLDHVTSQTGLIFPITDLVQQLTQQGIDTLIDGAHAPGMLDLNLAELGATYYTGNCHKWLCAPKGSAFLYVQPDRQPLIRPLTISHGANSTRRDRSRFRLEFDWMGTTDPTSHLSVPTAIQFIGSLLGGGWTALMAQNRQLALKAREVLCAALNVAPPCPDAMLGALAVVPLPDGEWLSLHNALLERYAIEVPIIPWGHPGGRQIRISAQIYNTLEQYDYLAIALKTLLAEGY
ncbi:MAG: aminotransferase class V-fold PLP-dependent enzyme [Leptolyngbyaceae cyanobacterium bins.302]|nr:aminotransferase class V-fold PLP-dependent enzyme [Leptolyngbyaceae cyanobacterium bins.302]